MFRRKGSVFAGVLFGLIMIVAFSVFLFKNEGTAVNRKKALENIDEAVEISSDGTSAVNDGDLIIVSGELETDDIIVDETFDITAPKNTIKLKKTVSLYQWSESSETDDSENTTYEYKKIWSKNLIDSSDFNAQRGHENPAAMIYTGDTFVANDVTLGVYTLDNSFVSQLNNYKPYKNMDMKIKDLTYSVAENKIFISANGKSTIESPSVGDYLIEYEIVSAESITVAGGVSGQNIISYQTKTGTLAEVSYGIKDKAVLKQEKIDENERRTWAVRIGLLFGMMFAVGLLFSPITNLLARIPILGNIVNGGIALVGGVIGGAWAIIVIAAGWLYYKPVLAISMIVGVVAVIVLVSRAKKAKVPAE
ncbi:MAG: TMEM43 family protein [Clostridia bacterium]|nr:TMEM43 family protein [Clostridia bacterium]